MGIRQLEAAILAEAKQVTGNKKLRQKDIMEWSSGPIKPHEGETIFQLPTTGVYISIKTLPPS